MEGGKERQRKRGRQGRGWRSDLDVWPQQPAGDGDMRAKQRKTDRKRERGGVKCMDDQIAQRAIEAEMEGQGGGRGR